MKWFKHMTDMHLSNSVEMFCSSHKDYAKGYGIYCILIGLCAEKMKPGMNPEFIISKEQLKSRLRMKWKCVERELLIFRECSDNEVIMPGEWNDNEEIMNENFVIIKMPKLKELLDNSTRNLQVACKNDSLDIDIDIDIDKDKDKDNNKTKSSATQKVSSNTFDFEAVYNIYPRKIGKTAGVKKLQSKIKTVEDYDKLVVAVKNYSLEAKGSEKKFIKHFTTFVNCWEDYIVSEKVEDQKLDDLKFYKAMKMDEQEIIEFERTREQHRGSM